jgi:RimJ/RimL family protein N-acetyltransferase
MANSGMTEKVLSLGTVVVFSIILPGLLLLGATFLLEPEIKKESIIYLSLYALLLGFAANVIGHFTGVIFRRLWSTYYGVPFVDIYLRSYTLPVEIANFLRKDMEFWFSIYCLYWNTAFGIPLIALANMGKFSSHRYLLAVFPTVFILLLYLSKQVLDGLIAISTAASSHRPEVSQQPMELTQKCITCLAPEHITTVAQILAHPSNTKNIWYTRSRENLVKILDSWRKDRSVYCLVATDDEKRPVGFARIQQWKHEKRNHTVWVGPLMVHPDHWRKGYGTALLTETIELCRKIKTSRIEISVPADADPMLRLVEKIGFKREGTQLQALKRNKGDYVDLVQYSYLLSDR